jgi:hypothetical protein
MRLIVFLIVVLEGGSLLTYEILAAKLYTPHLGSTIYVWTSILTLTLTALALSYRYSQKLIQQKKWKILPFSLLLAGVYIILILFTRNNVLPLTYFMEIRFAALFTGFFLLLIPVFCMGLTSPILSAWLSENQKNKITSSSGNFAGIVYGVGTLSGVVFTLICLFLLIPLFGVNLTVFFLAILLIFSGALSFYLFKNI